MGQQLRKRLKRVRRERRNKRVRASVNHAIKK